MLCFWTDGSVLSHFFLRKHCRVGTFIRIDLSPCCCAAHSICSIQSCFVSMRPCTLVAWLKPLHPSHLEVWFFQPCHHTHISSCLDTEIRALPTTQSHDSTNTESEKYSQFLDFYLLQSSHTSLHFTFCNFSHFHFYNFTFFLHFFYIFLYSRTVAHSASAGGATRAH